jgi:hypothetical protein
VSVQSFEKNHFSTIAKGMAIAKNTNNFEHGMMHPTTN